MQRTTALRAVWLLLLFLLVPTAAWGQLSDIRGRVIDRETGEAVQDATVALVGPDTAFMVVSDARGLFNFDQVRAGDYQVRVVHLAYGEHVELASVEADVVVALRILISQQAIELDPLVVEGLSARERTVRSRGTMIQEVTRAEIERAARTSQHLGDILRQTIPGLRVYDNPSAPGSRICVEFRGRRSIRFANSCQGAMLLLDGVRMYDPGAIYSTIQPSSIQRIEVVPPAEAGLLYGSDSAFGVVLIETKSWLDETEGRPIPPHLRGGVYDWTLEVEEHSWKAVFLSSLVGNVVGLAAGLAIADQCVEFSELATDLFATRCDGFATAGSWAAAISLPLAGAALGARFSGGTPLSQGRLIPAMVSGAIALLPGYALVAASQRNSGSASFKAGQIFAIVGIPAAVTIADRLFRKFKGR